MQTRRNFLNRLLGGVGVSVLSSFTACSGNSQWKTTRMELPVVEDVDICILGVVPVCLQECGLLD